jgi:5-methylcytosine-specific restriction endonuclease McrA
MMFPKPVKKQKEKKPFNSLRTKKKEKKPVPEWKQNILAHHKSKSEAMEGDEMLSKAFKECELCGWHGLTPTRTMNCPECKEKGVLQNKPEKLLKTKERFCECGCGAIVVSPRRFISGHNGRLNSKEGTYRKEGRAYTMIRCSECGGKFERRADQVNRRGLRNYCSKECMGVSQSRERKGIPIPALLKGENKNCKHCSKEFYARRSTSKRGGGKFCSRECFGKYLIDHPIKNFIGSADNSGKKNGRYVHGKRVGGHISKAKVRSDVIKRDGHWCMLCGKPGPGLHLHRVIYGSQGGKYQTDNCILFCGEHHDFIHSNKKKWQPLLLEYLTSSTNRPGVIEKIRAGNHSIEFIHSLANTLSDFSPKIPFGYGHFDD